MSKSQKESYNRINKKLTFWGFPKLPNDIGVGGDIGNQTKAALNHKDAELTDPNKLLEAGVAWEHEWGKKPPEAVTRKRQEIIKLGNEGKLTDPQEIAWYSLISIDTDDF